MRLIRLIIFTTVFAAGVVGAAAQEAVNPDPGDQQAPNICETEAPWRRNDAFDHRADNIKKASDWAKPALVSAHPAGGLSGIWNFELQGILQGGDVATNGHVTFYQEGEGYDCSVEIGCGYKPGAADAKWLMSGQRWGHKNYGLHTKDNPEDVAQGYITVGADGAVKMPKPGYYIFPEITFRFDPASPGRMTGRWTIFIDGKEKSGAAIFTRSRPKIKRIKYTSTLTDETLASDTGCVAMDYSSWWGPGNDMRGNRPGFAVEIYSDNLTRGGHYKIWIDPATKLEIDSSSPDWIFEMDAAGTPTGRVIGQRVWINIWPGSKWGPKTIYYDGAPINFDYYVKPVYDFALNPTKFQLVEGHYPDKPRIGAPTQIGFRLANVPDHKAGATSLNLSFVDARSDEPAKGVKVFDEACTVHDDGAVTCYFENTPVSKQQEFEFSIPMPQGGLKWFADWKTDGAPDASARSGVIDVDTAPTVIHSSVLGDQAGDFRQTGVFKYPYPEAGAAQSRQIILFGQHLSEKYIGASPQIESLDPAIAYVPRTGAVYSDLYEEAWDAMAKRFFTPKEELKGKFEILVLEAQMKSPLPGEKSLKLNGKIASWDLRYGGLKADIEFVRENDPDGDDEDDADDDVLTSAYVPEQIYVRVKTSSALPVARLPMVLHIKRTVRDPALIASGFTAVTISKRKFTATKTSQGYFYSPPIRLVNKGNRRLSPPPEHRDIPVTIYANGAGADQLSAEIDPAYAVKSFAMPILPAGGALPVSRSPAAHRSMRFQNQQRDYLFKSALAEAAQCRNDVAFGDWDDLSNAQAEAFRRLVVFSFEDEHIRKTVVTFGHHAAMLLLRKTFVDLLNEQISRNSDVLQTEVALSGFLDAMRLELDNKNIPVNRIKVTAPDGSQVAYGDFALMEDLKTLAAIFKTTPEAAARWRLQATAEAIVKINAGAADAASEAQQIDHCDIEGLLKLTGSGFGAVADKLNPRLMRLTEEEAGGRTYLYWEPDDVAREWVDNVDDTAARYRAQAQAAQQDNAYLTAAFGLASLPAMIYGSTSIALSLTAVDLTLLGADAVEGWAKAYHSYAEIDFSRDAAVVIGFDRNDVAVKNAYTWVNASTRMAVDLGFGALTVAGASQHIANGLLRGDGVVAKGRTAAQNMPRGGVRAMSQADQRSIKLFAVRSKAREAVRGAEALDAVERSAIAAVNEDIRFARTELIRNANASKPLGVGEEVALPFPFSLNEARVRFVPKPISPPGSGNYLLPAWTLEEPVKMLRAADDIGTDIIRAGELSETSILKGGGLSDDFIETEILRGGRLEDDLGTAIVKGGQVENPAILEAREFQRFLSETAQDKALHLMNKPLTIPASVTGAKPFNMHLGPYRGGGTYALTIETQKPFAEFETLLKLGYGATDQAAVAGKAYLKAVPSQHFVLPRESVRLPIPKDVAGQLRLFSEAYLVEDLGQSIEQILAKAATTEAERAAIRKSLKGALDDLNKSGVVMADYKLNNMARVERDSAVKIGFFDYGGFIRAKGGDPALAREMQNFLSGPAEEAFRILGKYGKSNLAVEAKILEDSRRRRDAFIAIYRDQIDDIEKLGVNRLDDFDFNPSGAQADKQMASMFTEAAR